MPRPNKNQPSLLSSVLKALAKLNDGATARRIADQIHQDQETPIRTSPRVNSTPNKLVPDVRTALRYGVENGLLKHQPERYEIDAQNILGMKPIKTCVCSKKNSGAEKRNRNISHNAKARKKKSSSTTISISESSSAVSYIATTESTVSSRSKTREREAHRQPTPEAKPNTVGRKPSRSSSCYRTKRMKRYDEEDKNTETTPEAKAVEVDRKPSESSACYRKRRMKRYDEESKDTEPEDKLKVYRGPSTSSSRHRQKRLKLCDENEENNQIERGSLNCDNKDCICNLQRPE